MDVGVHVGSVGSQPASDRSRLRRQLSRRGAMVARRFPMDFIGEGCEFDPRRRYIFVQFIDLTNRQRTKGDTYLG